MMRRMNVCVRNTLTLNCARMRLMEATFNVLKAKMVIHGKVHMPILTVHQIQKTHSYYMQRNSILVFGRLLVTVDQSVEITVMNVTAKTRQAFAMTLVDFSFLWGIVL